MRDNNRIEIGMSRRGPRTRPGRKVFRSDRRTVSGVRNIACWRRKRRSAIRYRYISLFFYRGITFLDPQPGNFVIDGTVDGGGHAAAIAEKIGMTEFAWTRLGRTIARTDTPRFADKKNVVLLHGNYAEIREIMLENDFGKADGLLVDLGFSSEQLEASGRGFSFNESSKNEPLLMTYDDSRTPVWRIFREEARKRLRTSSMNSAASGCRDRSRKR